MKRISIIRILSIAILISLLASCDPDSSGGEDSTDTTKLSGDWTIATTPDASTTDIGTISLDNMQYMGEMEIIGFKFYLWGSLESASIAGSDSADGSGYSLSGSYYQNTYTFSLTEDNVDTDNDGFENYVDFTVDNISGNNFSGTYETFDASGTFANVSGSFTATKQ